MKKRKEFAIIGGDLRQARLANALAADGHYVTVYGFDSDVDFLQIPVSKSLPEALESAGIVVLPLPAVFDGGYINAPLFQYKIEMEELLRELSGSQLLLAGRIDSKTASLIQSYNIEAVDYMKREELAVLNAIPTAEGGIEIAMRELPITLHGSRCLLLGFGRIGKILAQMLSGLGAHVTVAARKHDALAWAQVYGCDYVSFENLTQIAGYCDVIFNTIPAKVLTKDILETIHKETLIIDLASKPGGVDMSAAGTLGIKTIWALSLPREVMR